MRKTFLQMWETAIAAPLASRGYDPMGQACEFMKGSCDQNDNVLDLMPGVPRFIAADDLGKLSKLEGFHALEVTPGGRLRLHFRRQA